jgi:hypothetical protein
VVEVGHEDDIGLRKVRIIADTGPGVGVDVVGWKRKGTLPWPMATIERGSPEAVTNDVAIRPRV